MAFTDTPKIGVDLDSVISPTDYPRLGHRVLSMINASDGKIYVFAKAGAEIAADTAVVAINATTGVASASGGAYKAPAVTVPNGSYAWFGKTGA